MAADDFYDKIVQNVLECMNGYIEGEIALDEVNLAVFKEEMCVEYCKFRDIKHKYLSLIHEKLKKLYFDLNTMEKNCNELKLFKNEEVDVDMQQIFEHGMLLGRNRVPPKEAENSVFYTGAFPINKQQK